MASILKFPAYIYKYFAFKFYSSERRIAKNGKEISKQIERVIEHIEELKKFLVEKDIKKKKNAFMDIADKYDEESDNLNSLLNYANDLNSRVINNLETIIAAIKKIINIYEGQKLEDYEKEFLKQTQDILSKIETTKKTINKLIDKETDEADDYIRNKHNLLTFQTVLDIEGLAKRIREKESEIKEIVYKLRKDEKDFLKNSKDLIDNAPSAQMAISGAEKRRSEIAKEKERREEERLILAEIGTILKYESMEVRDLYRVKNDALILLMNVSKELDSLSSQLNEISTVLDVKAEISKGWKDKMYVKIDDIKRKIDTHAKDYKDLGENV